jgi:hypothetical protein
MENKRNHNDYLNDKIDGVKQKSTRELALEWWYNLSPYDEQHSLREKYYGEERKTNRLTGREIENIWLKETQLNPTTQVVREAMDIVSKDVRAPKVVREGIIKPNQKQFKIGDSVKCLNNVVFTDGSHHYRNSKYQVKKENEAYFNVNSKNYVLVSNQKQFKEFNPELFKAYIDKFSDEDKVAALRVMFKAIGITSKDKLEYYLAKH